MPVWECNLAGCMAVCVLCTPQSKSGVCSIGMVLRLCAAFFPLSFVEFSVPKM